MNHVVVLNADFTFHSLIGIQDAMSNIYQGKMEVILEDKNKQPWRSAGGLVFPVPKIVRLIKYIRGLFKKGVPATKANILIRDRHTCAYCSEKATECEHIMPKSRGGKITWENCVATCSACNRKKGNKTPSEAGMHIKYCKPVAPTISEFVLIRAEQIGVLKMLEEFWANSQEI